MSIPALLEPPFFRRLWVKQIAKRVLCWHLPVGAVTRPLFNTLFQIHVSLRGFTGWALRFFWYEPLFRSQCHSIGKNFSMERLPYLVGAGRIILGSNVQFSGKPSFAFGNRHRTSPQLVIGDGTFIGHNCAITASQEVSIGQRCLIAGSVRISDHDGHPLDADSRRQGMPPPANAVRPVTLGNDVWIGHGAMILKGVRLGDRAIVAARAVVTRDVPSDTIVAGNPARIIKQLPQMQDDE